MKSKSLLLLATCSVLLASCGYHAVGGRSSRLPSNVHTVAVPAFINETQTYRLEQILTRDVVRELISRTNYHVANEAGSADATLKGTVHSAIAAPLTYDANSGRVSSAIVTVTMKVQLVDRAGKVLFENPNYTFREQYQVSREVSSFFQEETPALQRMSRDFARLLVSDILEAY